MFISILEAPSPLPMTIFMYIHIYAIKLSNFTPEVILSCLHASVASHICRFIRLYSLQVVWEHVILFFLFFIFAHFLKNVEKVLWMTSNADKDGQVFKKNLWDFFLHFDPGSKRRYSYWTSSDSRNHCSLSENQMKWLFNELFRSNSCHRVECMSHLFCTAILYILWMDKNKRFWLCVLVCVCVNEDFEHFRV